MTGHKVDANQKEIVEFIRSRGYGWVDRSQQRPSSGYDGDLLAKGMIIPCEIKDPDLGWWIFTPKELETRALYRKFGITIHVIEYPEDVLRVVEMESEE